MKNPKKVSVLVIIQARMTSSRLPGKILMKIDGKPLIQHIIERARKARNVDEVVLATSENKSNDPVEKLCKKIGVHCFRGSEEDVLARFIGAAEKFNPELVVRICGDQPLFDISLLEALVDKHKESGCDYSTNSGLVPKALNFEVINYAVLKKVAQEAKDKPHREHITKFIVDHPERFKIQLVSFGKQLERPDLVLTVDTREDFEFVKKVYFALKKQGKHQATVGVAQAIISIVDNKIAARKPIILLRADASKEKGIGDVVSLMNIAEHLKSEYELIFASKDYAEGVDFIKSKGYEVFSLAVECTKEEDLSQIRALCDKRKIRHCIVELVPNDVDYVKELSQFLKTLMVNLMIDFFGSIEVYSDILVCWDLDAKELRYDFKNNQALKLFGPGYAPLNSQLQKYVKKKNNARIKKITISFGGSDPHDLSFALLDALANLTDKYELTFVLGPGFKKSDDFANKIKEKKIDEKIRIIQSPKNIHELLSKSDLVISGGGLTSFELCALGVPFIGISMLEWEIIRLKKLASFGICRFIQANDQLKDSLLQALKKLSSLEVRNKMTKKGMKLVDGKGALRIANAIKTRWKA